MLSSGTLSLVSVEEIDTLVSVGEVLFEDVFFSELHPAAEKLNIVIKSAHIILFIFDSHK